MDKKEMQHWIDYLNNGGNALDMLDELERKAEEKRRENKPVVYGCENRSRSCLKKECR